VTQCGDGLILGTENCDTGNIPSAGCRNCQIQTGWTCSGQPSVCRSNTPVTPTIPTTPTAPTVPTTPTIPTTTTANLYQFGKANVNTNNVFITLKTRTTFTFASDTEKQNFMQSSFPSGPKPTVYCSQRTNPELDTFDCLLIYNSGVPNAIFDVNFSYSKNGISGATTVTVDPFAVSNSRSTRRGI
jgi:cysteine-rich repeat protein